MKKIVILSLFISLFLPIWAGQVKITGDIEEFPIFNRNNSKIYNYHLIKPGGTAEFTVSGADTLDIITRVLLNDKNYSQYEYSLQMDDEIRRVQKAIKKSNITRGIGGEEVSTYNNLKISLQNDIQKFRFGNISSFSILIKLNADQANQSNPDIEYIRYTPDIYGSEMTLLVGEKAYTYYATNSDIKVTLEGPVVLKIISRLLFDSNFVNKRNYEYKVFDNGEMVSKFTEDAYKSEKSVLKNKDNIIPSTGDVNIIKFGKGIHEIVIRDGAVNRDIIFRLYISKTSVELEKQ